MSGPAAPDSESFPRSETEFDAVDSYRMPLMEHLRELRRRLVFALVAAGLGFAVCFNWVNEIWAFLVAPMEGVLVATDADASMVVTEPLEGFLTLLKVAGVAGLGLASPVIFAQMWMFIAPGLYAKEKKVVIPLMLSSTVLFLGGGAFCYFVILDVVLPFLIGVIPQVTPDDLHDVVIDTAAYLKISSYLTFVTRLIVAFGVTFQLPVIAFFLARIGLIDHHDMIRFFRYAVVGIFVIASILTPPDIVSQILLAGPLVILYGVGIIVAWAVSTKEREAPPEDGAAAG